jgi:hypothetical protein
MDDDKLITFLQNDSNLTEEVRSEALDMAREKASLKTFEGDITK